MRVVEIWRYPVKSLGGESLESVDVGPGGIVGDRAWGVRDRATGLVLTARREPELLFLSATWQPDRPVITDGDGNELTDDSALSDALGRDVELVAASDGTATFENPMNVDDETDWVQWESAGRTFHDGRSTVSLVSTASLGEWDRRRFRINLILDGDGDGERALTDTVGIGSAQLAIRRPLQRCIMVTRAQPDIERDLGVLKQIIAERDNQLGVGATVESSGCVAVGDPVIS